MENEKQREAEKIEVPAADYLCAHILCVFVLFVSSFLFGFSATKWFVHMSSMVLGFGIPMPLYSRVHILTVHQKWTKAIFSLSIIFSGPDKIGENVFVPTKFIDKKRQKECRLQEIPF